MCVYQIPWNEFNFKVLITKMIFEIGNNVGSTICNQIRIERLKGVELNMPFNFMRQIWPKKSFNQTFFFAWIWKVVLLPNWIQKYVCSTLFQTLLHTRRMTLSQGTPTLTKETVQACPRGCLKQKNGTVIWADSGTESFVEGANVTTMCTSVVRPARSNVRHEYRDLFFYLWAHSDSLILLHWGISLITTQ